MTEIKVEIQNMDRIQDALNRFPDKSKPIFQKAVNAAGAYLGKYSTRPVVPWRTGNLMHSFRLTIGDLQAEWKPTAYYAVFVNNGTIKQRANPFMEKIRSLAEPDITRTFEKAVDQAVKAIWS